MWQIFCCGKLVSLDLSNFDYNKEHSTRSILDELPSKLFFIFPSQNTVIPPVPTVTVPNAFQPKNLPPPVSSIVKPPVIVPNQDLYMQPPIANIPIMPENTINFGINSDENYIPYGNLPVPINVPYENNIAPISTATPHIIPVRANQYTNNVNLSKVKTYPVY